MDPLEELQETYGQEDSGDERPGMSMDDMLGTEPPAPPPPEEEAPEQAQATLGASPDNLGHPDVLAKLKEITSKPQYQTANAPGVPGGLTPMSAKTQVGGMTPEQAGQDTQVRGQAEIASGGVQQSRLHQQADLLEMQARSLRVQAQVEDEQRQKAEHENAAKQARLRDQQQQLSEQHDEKIDPKRYYHDMSLFDKGTAILSAAIYGYLNPKGGAPPIVDQLQQGARQDVQAQLEDRRANGEARSTRMQQLERQYGDTAQVAKMLEADKLLTLAKKARAEGVQSGSADAKAKAEDMGKELEIRAGVLNQDVQKAEYAKPVEVTYARPKPVAAGAGASALYEKALKLDKDGQAQGMSKEERAAMIAKAGLPPIIASGPTAEEAKASKLSPEQDKDVRTRIDGLAGTQAKIAELDAQVGLKRDKEGKIIGMERGDDAIGLKPETLLRDMGHGLPWHLGDVIDPVASAASSTSTNKVRGIRDQLAGENAKATFGRVNPVELDQNLHRLPLTNQNDFASGLATIEAEQHQVVKNLRAQYGDARVDEMLRERGIDPGKFGGTANAAPKGDRRAAPAESAPTYETALSPREESEFRAWKAKYAPHDSGDDYDLRGAFKAGVKPSARNGHWPDTFKKPNHETFSVESQYAKDRPDLAGHWEGDVYVTPDGRRITGK